MYCVMVTDSISQRFRSAFEPVAQSTNVAASEDLFSSLQFTPENIQQVTLLKLLLHCQTFLAEFITLSLLLI